MSTARNLTIVLDLVVAVMALANARARRRLSEVDRGVPTPRDHPGCA